MTDKEKLIILANHIYEWCSAIDEKGSGWDEWDYFYKNAYYREDEQVYKIVKENNTCKKQDNNKE